MISEPYNTILIVIGIGTLVMLALTILSLFMLLSALTMNAIENKVSKEPRKLKVYYDRFVLTNLNK